MHLTLFLNQPILIKIESAWKIKIVAVTKQLHVCVIESISQIIELELDITDKMTRELSKDSDQPGHPLSLIRVFAVCFVGS